MAANLEQQLQQVGLLQLNPYEKVGSLAQTYGFGWGTSGWGGSSGVISVP